MTTPFARHGIVGFAVRFIVVFAVLLGGFEALRGTTVERTLIEDGLLAPTTWIAQHLSPGEPIRQVGRAIESPRSRLNVIRGCEGIETLLLLVAAVIAYPASWAARGKGLFVGGVLAYVLSVARLVALHMALRHSPQAWEALHGLVLPLVPIVLVSWYFLHWSALQPRSAATAAASNAS